MSTRSVTLKAAKRIRSICLPASRFEWMGRPRLPSVTNCPPISLPQSRAQVSGSTNFGSPISGLRTALHGNVSACLRTLGAALHGTVSACFRFRPREQNIFNLASYRLSCHRKRGPALHEEISKSVAGRLPTNSMRKCTFGQKPSATFCAWHTYY